MKHDLALDQQEERMRFQVYVMFRLRGRKMLRSMMNVVEGSLCFADLEQMPDFRALVFVQVRVV